MFAANACERIMLCAAMNGSVIESPELQLPNGFEHRSGGNPPIV